MKIEDYNAKREKQKKINLKLLASGVDFIDIDQAYIDENVEIGAGTVIYPCVVIKGKNRIGENSWATARVFMVLAVLPLIRRPKGRRPKSA